MITPTAPQVRHGYRCEGYTQSPATGDVPALVNIFNTTEPGQAIRWIRRCLTTLLLAVDTASREHLTDWIDADHEKALAALEHGQPCTVATGYGDVHLEWTARPVIFLPLLPPPRTPVISYKLLCAHADRRAEFE